MPPRRVTCHVGLARARQTGQGVSAVPTSQNLINRHVSAYEICASPEDLCQPRGFVPAQRICASPEDLCQGEPVPAALSIRSVIASR